MIGRALKRGVAEWLLVATGIWLIGLGLYFVAVRPALLPEDVRYIGTELVVLQAAAPNIAHWLDHVFTVMGGFMAGAGVLLLLFTLSVLPEQPRGTVLALSLAGVVTVGVMSGVNFALHSDFRWLLLGPPIAWAIALGLLVMRRST